jgi:Holliday junction DNA helicase RuvB
MPEDLLPRKGTLMSKKLQLNDLIGNKNIHTQLTIANGAARLHNKAMGHILFSGLAGCGKTSTATALSYLSDVPFFEVSAESIKSAEDLADLFSKFPADGYDEETGDKEGTICPPILFIDEAHRLTLKTQEMLGIAMESYRHSFTTGRGKKKVPQTAWVPEFTIICATTKEGMLSKPFRDRFKFSFVFNSYSIGESKDIIKLHANRKNIELDDYSIGAIARRSRGTPRLLVRYLDSLHDAMLFMERERITDDLAEAQFNLMGIDLIGLRAEDIQILKDLHSCETPQGLDTLAVKTNLDPKTISEVNEPYLVRLGFIERTKGGRIITELGTAHLIEQGHIERPEIEAGMSRILRKV